MVPEYLFFLLFDRIAAPVGVADIFFGDRLGHQQVGIHCGFHDILMVWAAIPGKRDDPVWRGKSISKSVLQGAVNGPESLHRYVVILVHKPLFIDINNMSGSLRADGVVTIGQLGGNVDLPCGEDMLDHLVNAFGPVDGLRRRDVQFKGIQYQ